MAGISQHYFSFPAYLPKIYGLLLNWREYLVNYMLRRRVPTEYLTRSGMRLIDSTGTLAGTFAVVFVRQEYGPVDKFTVIVDIGANMGCFALYAAAASPTARIFCYEPEQQNFVALRANIAANGLGDRIIPIQAAVGAARGLRTLITIESPLNSLHATNLKGAKSQSVDCVTLTDIMTSNNLDAIDLLKLNCEGSEYEILLSCDADCLRRVRNVRLEYHNLKHSGHTGHELLAVLKAHGYEIRRFTRYKHESGFVWATRPATAVHALKNV